ncbi:uncharacterized protein LOC144454021 [Glandiceps talaboti]
MKNLCLLLPVVVVVVFNISMVNAATDFAATTLTLKIPAPATGGFVKDVETDITLDLVYTIDTTADPTAAKAYFSNADGSKKTNPEVVVSGGPTTSSGAITSGGSYTGLTAKITLDATNCGDYTKLCVAVTVTDDDANNNVICIDFGVGADKAGTKTCNVDFGATKLTLKTPDPATGGFTKDTATDITFDLEYTVAGSVNPTAAKTYFSNADGSKKTTPEVAVSGGPTASSGAITASGSYTGLTAKITLDGTNCADYTKLCAAVTVTDDVATNNVACVDFGKGADKAGTNPCAAGSSANTSSTLMALTMVIAAIMSWRM